MATVKGEIADRPPVSAWRHFPGKETSAVELARAMLDFHARFDWDFIKVNPRAVYYHEAWGNEYDYSRYNDIMPTRTRTAIADKKDLWSIGEVPGTAGPFAEQLEALRLIKQGSVSDIPIFQTIFTPIGILANLCGLRSLGRYREAPRAESALIKLMAEEPAGVHSALRAIARTLATYAAAVLETGVDGVFYAALGMARTGYFTRAEWEEFVRPYDLMVLEPLKAGTTLLHTCGIYGNPEWFVDWPIDVLHWAESATGNPGLKDSASWIGDKIPMGGVDERLFGTGAADEIARRARATIETMKGRPFVLAPDCSVSINTRDDELAAFRGAVES
jgi:uroporphyrinogen decarboxylase